MPATLTPNAAALDDLVAGNFAAEKDLTDPDGKRFEYQPTARKLMPDLPRQTHTLRCNSIKAGSGYSQGSEANQRMRSG